jgi:hypothetical protein
MKQSIKNQKTNALSTEALVQLAKAQNKKRLYDKFPNIEHISGQLIDDKRQLTIYVNDDKIQEFPKSLSVKFNDEIKLRIKTNILPPPVSANFWQEKNGIGNQNQDTASICCLVKSPNGKLFVVTVGHFVYNDDGSIANWGKKIPPNERPTLFHNSQRFGRLFYQRYDNYTDIAVIELNDLFTSILPNEMKSFPNIIQHLSPKDVMSKVVVLSKSGQKTGYVFDVDSTYQPSATIIRNHIIKIGKITPNRDKLPITGPGDSGSCVYSAHTGNLLGMILGNNNQYSYVLPIGNIFHFAIKPLKFTLL